LRKDSVWVASGMRDYFAWRVPRMITVVTIWPAVVKD
jgi:hypothetical protein